MSLLLNRTCLLRFLPCVRLQSQIGPISLNAAARLCEQIIDCKDWSDASVRPVDFWSGLIDREIGDSSMLKLKDWPPGDSFSRRLVRHNDVRLSLPSLPMVRLAAAPGLTSPKLWEPSVHSLCVEKCVTWKELQAWQIGGAMAMQHHTRSEPQPPLPSAPVALSR